MTNNDDKPATKDDIKELKQWMLEHEIVQARWTLGLLALYFFGTLASVWFLVNQQTAQISQLLQHWKP